MKPQGASRQDATDDPTFAEAFDDLATKRVVLCGECTHDTSAFYRARAAITQRLVERRGFSFVAVDALGPHGRRGVRRICSLSACDACGIPESQCRVWRQQRPPPR